jgi:Carboxypeptidase regulatory-like domain
MRRLFRLSARHVCRLLAMTAVLGVSWPVDVARAQGVTTGVVMGIVKDVQGQPVIGAGVTAIHLPSGTAYETVTRGDGRFSIPGMRVGGPYSVTVFQNGTGALSFEPQIQENVTVNLGAATDLVFEVRPVIQEQVLVTAQSDPAFSSERTGAATSISRETLATLPTITGRLESMTRLTPQAGNTMSFAGQDNRLNNITVDGSYFNNSFGLAGTPGERTGVAPISLSSIEQVQVSVAPYDVRQGNFVGAAVNTVTRSGTNALHGSFSHAWRDESLVGTKAAGATFNPGTFTYRNTGGWASGPVLKNRLFFFGSYENEKLEQPGTTFRANTGGEPVGGNVTRVLASDLETLSNFLSSGLGYDPGSYQEYDAATPAKRYLAKFDYNLSDTNKLSFRYNQLDSITDVLASNSSSLGFGNRRSSTFGLNFENSNYQILENIRSGVGEWNSILGDTMANSMIVGYTKQDESRASRGTFFPFVDVLEGGSVYTSFGFEPFTPNNELRYNTFQLQNNFTKYGAKHGLTIGGSYEHYYSENVFFPGSQSIYVYNSLGDFYTDANGFLADPNRTTSPVTLRTFQVRWNNIPGQEKPLQPLRVNYAGAYVQDDWRVRDNVKINAGLRLDVPVFDDTGFTNADADALTFMDEAGRPVQYSTGKLPDPNILWSPRLGFNWDLTGDRTTQVRGGTGVFTGRPAYVWISNQIGNTGVLTGFEQLTSTTARPFNADPDYYKPTTVTGAPASSYELALTDEKFKFPQVWRSNIAVDRRLFGGWTGTAEYLYNRDVNGVYYINANLAPPDGTFSGADARPRWVATNRINSNVANAIVLKNQDVGTSWNLAFSAERALTSGFWMKTAYSYGESKNTVDPGSIAAGSWTNNQHSGDPNNPGIGYSLGSPGHRWYLAASYTRRYFRWGATTVSGFWESRNGERPVNTGSGSYVFSGDLNNDGSTSNDLIYVPRDASEMNFQTFVASGRTFTAAEQAATFETFISGDEYLSKHRGQYVQRNAVFLPLEHRLDFNIAQDLLLNFAGREHRFQFRVDALNFTNLLNSNWGVGNRFVSTSPLIVPTAAQGGVVDAQGRAQYRLRVVNNELITRSIERTAGTNDVYRVQFSIRYSF